MMIPVIVLFSQADKICKLTPLQPEICDLAGNYLCYYIFGVYCQIQFATYTAYLFCIKLEKVPIIIMLGFTLLHIYWCDMLVAKKSYGFYGCAYAMNITYGCMLVAVVAYDCCS